MKCPASQRIFLKHLISNYVPSTNVPMTSVPFPLVTYRRDTLFSGKREILPLGVDRLSSGKRYILWETGLHYPLGNGTALSSGKRDCTILWDPDHLSSGKRDCTAHTTTTVKLQRHIHFFSLANHGALKEIKYK